MSKRTKNGSRGCAAKCPGSRSPSVWLRHAAAPALFWCLSVSMLPVHRAGADPSAAIGQDRWTTLGSGVVKDAQTKLQWMQNDNRDDIDWYAAKAFCEQKDNGWRLPSLPELKSIYDEREGGVACGRANCKVAAQFHLTGTWLWSATQVGKDSTDGIELAWGVLMVNGAQTQTVRDAGYGSRVLCVRGP
jgi:hypothetical protein